MAHDLFHGRTRANHAISGHPPIESYQWDFVRGIPPAAKQKHASQPRTASASNMGAKVSVWPPEFKLYEISQTDYDAAKRWMANIAENVKYHRKVHGDRILTTEDEELWGALWRKWLLFGNKLKELARDKGLMNRIIATTLPVLHLSRLFAVHALDVGMMSEENKREFDAILHTAKSLQKRFELLGMGQVPVPYMSELVLMIRQIPPQLPLQDMATRLKSTAKVGSRLLDANTAWWQWKVRTETGGLRRATAAAEKLAEELTAVSKSPEGQGLRERDTPVYQRFMRAISLVYIEAAGLYGIEETKTTARAQLKEDLRNMPRDAGKMALWILFVAGVGYLGIRLLTRKQIVVVETPPSNEHPGHPGYHPHSQTPGRGASETGHHHDGEVDTDDGREENISQESRYREHNPDSNDDEYEEDLPMSFDTDESVASELVQFTENDGDIYRQMTQSILKNLATKKAQGKYDADKAVQAFMYLAEAGAKKYAKEFGGVWHEHFPIQIRRMAATHWRDEFETEYGLGNYNNLLPIKYRQPSQAQARALFHFFHIEGGAWKKKLSDCWMHANYPGMPEGVATLLQQVRNELGPSWLAQAKLSTIRKIAELTQSYRPHEED